MKRGRLVNVQWRFIRVSLWMCGLMALVTVGLNRGVHWVTLQELWKKREFGLPLVILLILGILIIGLSFGYVFGNLIKKRLEILVSSILYFERGTFSHRVPELGEDEIGQVGGHLNEMARQIEAQVAALQKLSSEKATWNDQMKQTAVNEERQRLARELHDAVSQQLFAISMLSSAVRETLGKDPEATAKQIETIEKMAGYAQNEMRALLLHLRPTHLDGKMLKEGLEELLVEFQSKQSIKMVWEIDDIRGLPKGVEDHLFRIVQEGLSNILRHAKAKTVYLRLNRINQQVILKIRDDGMGFQLAERHAASYGLASIEERVNEIGGVVKVVSAPGKGTEIEVKVPIIEDRDEVNEDD